MGANADLVRKAWDAFGKGDIDGAVSTTDESAEIVLPDSLPWGGTYEGPEGFKEMIGKFMSNFESVDIQPGQFLEADGDHVVVTVTGASKTKSGNELGGESLWLYEVKDGKIAGGKFFGDTAAAVEALS
jgi:ketosteroid isomerase-like protein